MATIHRTEGLILKTLKFQEYDQIISSFTPGDGILKLFVKQALNQKRRKGPILTPFSRVEFIYRPTKGEFCACQEISLLNSHFHIRNTLETLEAAADMLQATLATQMPNKAAPAVYQLLVRYLEKLPFIQPPEILSSSYRLKILQHEGLLNLQTHCCMCDTPLNTKYVYKGEIFCEKDAPPYSIRFSEEEFSLLHRLAFCKTFKELAQTPFFPQFHVPIKKMFNMLLK